MEAPSSSTPPSPSAPARPKFVPVVGPRLKIVLMIVFALFALLGVNSAYLSAITFLEWRTGVEYQNYFYLLMFAAHIALGLLITVPVIAFGVFHARNAHNRPNRWAKRVGWALFATAIVLLVTGFALTRLDVIGISIDLKDPAKRSIVYWAHVITPIIAIWLFVLHRMAGRRIKWRVGIGWGLVGAAAAVGMAAFHSLDPRDPNVPGPRSEAYFEPSLARTATGNFIPPDRLMMNEYCLECHADVYDTWQHSMHAFSSFNNPFYAFSVRETRKVGHARDGDVHDARFCAGCHDPVPFFSGAFDDPKWDDPEYAVHEDPLGKASITCTACHSIVHVGGTRGNAEYTIEESPHYPFVDSESPFLRWVNRQLIKAKPAFHKRTFLKPEVHRSDEFCSTCHKVHLPVEVNDYKWLRGQNHYDSFRLSGVSGHGVMSWYYPPKAESNCNGCHMQPIESDDFGAKMRDGRLAVLDHRFPSANTAVLHALGLPESESMIKAVEAFNAGVMRVDIMAVREGGEVDGTLHAPLRPTVPTLRAGETYLFEVVTRTVRMGHEFTQGTADSNEVWLDVTVRADGRVIGRSGGFGEHNAVDPWSKFFNIFMLDREGNRIDRRNPQDIFVPLYNNQIPPGAADITQYLLTIPEDTRGPLEFSVALRYRKFDTIFVQYVFGAEYTNDLPVVTLATDLVRFPVLASTGEPTATAADTGAPPPPELWQRWHDYGIALFRTADRGAGRGLLVQAEAAFNEVTRLGRPEGPLGLSRVFLREGRIDEAVTALGQAARNDPPAFPWSVAWFSGLVAKQQGNLEEAADFFRQVVDSAWPLARERGFDFSRDDRLRVELAETLMEIARTSRGDDAKQRGEALLTEARDHLRAAVAEDSELASAHYLLAQVYDELGDPVLAAEHRAKHAVYRPDDNARDSAVNAARIRYPAANRAAEAVVLYDLQRAGAFGLDLTGSSVASEKRPASDAPAAPREGTGQVSFAGSEERSSKGLPQPPTGSAPAHSP
jgi:tetratricopeptide (TPR) repeat protein